MAHTPAPDPALTPGQLASKRIAMRDKLIRARMRRDEALAITDYLKQLEAVRKSNAEIRPLVDVAYNQLGIAKTELADILGMTRQNLWNIQNHKVKATA